MGIGQQRAARVTGDEGLECRDGVLVLARLEGAECCLVVAGLCRRINLRRGLDRRRHGRGLQLAQAAVEVDVEVALPFLRRFQIVAQYLDLAAQTGHFGAQRLALIGEVDLVAVGLVHTLAHAVEIRTQLLDPRARLVVVE